jgi:ketosteroid isomerase-like protein
MSEENVEIVRRSYEAFDRGDIPAWLNGLDPEIVLHENADFPASPTFQGHEGMLRWIESVEEIWEEGRFHPETFRSAGTT